MQGTIIDLTERDPKIKRTKEKYKAENEKQKG